MEASIASIMIQKGFDPRDLVTYLQQTIAQEREFMEIKRQCISFDEFHETEMRLTRLEILAFTLSLENLEIQD
jgi:hypothetical protein